MDSVDEPVELVAYDSAWPDLYRAEAARIVQHLAGLVITEHIGSTAVPQLPSKPVIDIMVGMPATQSAGVVTGRLPELGYEDCGGVPGRRYFRRRAEHAFNAQAVEQDGELWRANLLFRDYLRHNGAAAHAYGQIKAAAARAAPTLLSYSAAKQSGLEDLLDRARDWDNRGRPSSAS